MAIHHRLVAFSQFSFAIGATVLALCPLALQAASLSPMCFTDVTIRPGSAYDVAPVIDGNVKTTEWEWINAWRYVFNNGTYVHDVVVQGIKDTSNIYLSFEVNHDDSLNTDDEIVLTIDPNPGSSATRHYIRIFPVVLGAVASPIVIETAQSTTGSAWPQPNPMPVNTELGANGREVAASASVSTGNNSWTVELKLPMAVFGIPSSGGFGMYVNVLPVKGGFVTEYPWPPNSPMMNIDDLNTPPIAQWGTAKTNATACNGVYVQEADIYTGNTPPSKISTTLPNTFHAIVHNSTIDAAGNNVTANHVSATFRIANFGLSGAWNTIPPNGGTAPNNPTPSQSIPGNSSRDFTMDWKLGSNEFSDYQPPHDHQCILVDLDSDKGACVGGPTVNAACNSSADCGPASNPGVCQPTLFSVRSIYRNMDFSANSTFTSTPEVNTNGWKGPPPGQNQLVELMVTKQLDRLNRDLVSQWLSGKNRDTTAASNVKFAAQYGTWESLKNMSNWPAPRDANYNAFVDLLGNPSTQVSQLTYLVHGCRHSGEFIKIHSTNYEICEPVGSFGYVLRHAGIGEANWSMGLQGAGLTKVPGAVERYRLSVAGEKSAQLNATFTAVDSSCNCGCNDTACLLKCQKQASNDSGTVSGTLALIGSLGVGGLAFLRRRRNQESRDPNEGSED